MTLKEIKEKFMRFAIPVVFYEITNVECVYSIYWVPVTTEWRVLRLRIEGRPPIRRVAANKLNMQSWTADEGWSSAWGLGEVLTTPPCKTLVKKHSHAGKICTPHQILCG